MDTVYEKASLVNPFIPPDAINELIAAGQRLDAIDALRRRLYPTYSIPEQPGCARLRRIEREIRRYIDALAAVIAAKMPCDPPVPARGQGKH